MHAAKKQALSREPWRNAISIPPLRQEKLFAQHQANRQDDRHGDEQKRYDSYDRKHAPSLYLRNEPGMNFDTSDY
ncbi:MAG TPA: hypothetical protein VI483_02560 [Candidatus Paceibacterota bacterium]